MRVKKGFRVGLALGGGAARGLAHLGVLKALAREQVPIHAVAGVSVGSIIAAGVAAGLSPDRLLDSARSVTWRDMGGLSFSFKGFNRNLRMEQWLAKVLPVRRFEDLQIPLRIVATDLHSGAPVVLEKGELFPAIRASCAIPGLYVPVEIDGVLLADGYLTCNLPIAELRGMGVDVALASAIGLEVSENIKLNNVYQILMRSFSIMSAAAQRARYRDADVVFEPDVKAFSWSDITALPQLLKAGERSVEDKRNQLREALDPSLWTRLNWNPWRSGAEK